MRKAEERPHFELLHQRMTIIELSELCGKNGLTLGKSELGLLERYATLLLEWNQKINLVSRKDESNLLERHILHSLTLRMPAICDFTFSGTRAIDIGTGGGLPGIPLRIVTPGLRMTLIDSIQKKIAADSDMIARLALSDMTAVAGRVEELARQSEFAHRFDVVVSRAVAPLEDLLNWSRGHLKSGGTLFSLKGGDLSDEARRAERLSFVDRIEIRPLHLVDYDEFEKEEKKLVRVDLK